MWNIFKKKKIKKLTKANNVVNLLHIHKDRMSGIWWFNDEELGIVREPFVGDCNLMIDMYAQGEEEMLAYVSEYYIKGETNVLIRVNGTLDIYQLDGTNIQGWMCSCLLNYFKDYPDFLHFKLDKIK